MNAFLRSCVFCCALLYSWCTQAAEPTVAVYYGDKASLSELSLYDIAVVEPDHGYDPVRFRKQAPGSELYAYASVAEVQRRGYFQKIPAEWKMARNGAWRSIVVDQTPAQWPAFFADEVIAPLWDKGFRGFFLDTLDSYRLAERFDEAAQGRAGPCHRHPTSALSRHQADPQPRLRNRATRARQDSDGGGGVAVSRLGCQPQALCRDTGQGTDWLQQQLQTIRERDKLPVLSIDYVAPDRDTTRASASRNWASFPG